MAVVVATAILVLQPAQLGPNGDAPGWLRDYRNGLRYELIDGALPQAITAYRRVIVSEAPRVYAQRARYRLANVLKQVGQVDQATAMLRSLREELPETGALAERVSDLLSRGGARLYDTAHWAKQLVQAARRSDLGPLKVAAEVLARQDGPDGVRILIDAYDKLASTASAQAVLIRYLARSESLEGIDAIRKALDETATELTAAAALAAGEIGDAASGDRLIQLLSSSLEPRVRQSSARALGLLCHRPATDVLIEVAGSDPDRAVRRAAVRALREIGSDRAGAALSAFEDASSSEEATCCHSPWYRKAVVETIEPQLEFTERDAAGAELRAPTIGVVISALSHHARLADGLYQPYSRQLRKAWTFRRAGFDVCLLAEPEVLGDPAARGPLACFSPRLRIYPLGRWPRCDVVLLDELVHLPAEVVRTVLAYVKAGGRVVACGAVGGGCGGDRVALRELLGVRRPHPHRLYYDEVRLRWVTGGTRHRVPALTREPWVTRRRGTFYAHEVLAGHVLAVFEAPPIWAIKSHDLGRGRVMCLNWGPGLNADGPRDEDELLCRCVDVLVDRADGGGPRYQMMRNFRWGDLSKAKTSVDAPGLPSLSRTERVETITQLFRIYLEENNAPEGRRVCRALLRRYDGNGADRSLAEGVARVPKRLQIALHEDKGQDATWWLDVPRWLRPTGEVPLWLTGPTEVPVEVRLRVWPAAGKRVRFRMTGARLVATEHAAGEPKRLDGDAGWELTCQPDGTGPPWVQVHLSMSRWRASVRTEIPEDG